MSEETQGPIVSALDTLDNSIHSLQERVQVLSLKVEHVCSEPQVDTEASALENVQHQHDTSSRVQQRIRRMNDDLQHAIDMLHVLYDTLEV